MMDFYRRYQTAILFIVVVWVAYAGYQFFFASTGDPVLTVSEEATSADQEFIALLFELRGITLDNAVFGDPVFKSLSDFSLELVPEPVGRDNPFAPLGATPTAPAR